MIRKLYPSTLSPELESIRLEVHDLALKQGLDCFPILFELVNIDQLNAIAARGGFPNRYLYWRFGMEYEQLKKSYSYGLQKIYELVINNDPCYAYLLDSNAITDHKLVMAHVYGHCDFFKNNAWFAHTNRKMMDQMANHGIRIQRLMDEHGIDAVEEMLDCALSLDSLIDPHSVAIRRRRITSPDEPKSGPQKPAFQFKSYMNRFVDSAVIDKTVDEEIEAAPTGTLEEPMRDVILFLMEYAPLKSWQIEVLSIVRDEAYYFVPQGQTKIMNEGWATYWHSRLMTEHLMEANDLVCYADHCSGTLATNGRNLNPYKLGVEMFRHIEQRWNKGQFGEAWENCDNAKQKQAWDLKTGLGRQKIFEVRQAHNDLTFIDEFLTPEFCKEQQLFAYDFSDDSEEYSRQFSDIKRQLLNGLTNMGRPEITVVDGNYLNRGQLLLYHRYEGQELKLTETEATLANLSTLWKRPVHIQTVVNEEEAMVSYDSGNTTIRIEGEDHSLQEFLS